MGGGRLEQVSQGHTPALPAPVQPGTLISVSCLFMEVVNLPQGCGEDRMKPGRTGPVQCLAHSRCLKQVPSPSSL